MDLGQQRRGVDMGPSAMRYADLQKQIELLDLATVDHGNIVVPNPEEAVASIGNRRLTVVAQVCSRIFTWGKQYVASDDFLLFLGGDHSISIGSVKAVANGHPQKTGVIWIDAHADFNTPETSPSGNLHGMPVAIFTGEGPSALVDIGDGVSLPLNNVVQIGIRDVDRGEAARLHELGLCVFTMREIDEHGVASIVAQSLDLLSHCNRIHVSLDMDSLDPVQAPGVGTPVKGGLNYREAHLMAEILGESGKVFSMDVVEVNPILDAKNLTATLAVELIASMLGKRIL